MAEFLDHNAVRKYWAAKAAESKRPAPEPDAPQLVPAPIERPAPPAVSFTRPSPRRQPQQEK